jgi:hypothetical protein
MILNAPPTLLRVYTQPKETANLHPYDMAGWWVAGRAGRTQPPDSASLCPNCQAIRTARPRWPRLRKTSKVRCAVNQKVHGCNLGFGASKS